MEFDDLPKKRTDNFMIGQDLSKFSVEEIEAILLNLGEEVARLQQEKEKKKASLAAAHSLFNMKS